MVKGYSVSDDKLTYTFTLRDGLKFHDGAPVTSADCIASIQRWGKRDGMGQKLMDFTKELTAIHDKTFKLVLKQPYGRRDRLYRAAAAQFHSGSEEIQGRPARRLQPARFLRHVADELALSALRQ
jgi:ABC-type transport system substrate-binding protein